MSNPLKYISPRIREELLLARGLVKNLGSDTAKRLKKLAAKDDPTFYAAPRDVKLWADAFKKLSLATDKRGFELAEEFYSQPLEIISENYFPRKQELVLICPAKDELDNLKRIYSHYKRLGVKAFAFIDNGSSDGTAEYFSDFKDVNVYLAREKYTSLRRQAWINRVMARYGFGKWYLVVDSDEYLDYNGSENRSVYDIANYCEKKGIKRVKALMLDMYPEKINFDGRDVDFLKEYCYFDKSGYTRISGRDELLIKGFQGGVRARIFAENENDKKPWITKYPLIYLQPGDIQFQSHMSYPFYKNFSSDTFMVLRHYKFLPSDYEKYKLRAADGNFSAGSREYQQYVQMMKKGSISFFDDRVSAKLEDSNSVYQIDIMSEFNWE